MPLESLEKPIPFDDALGFFADVMDLFLGNSVCDLTKQFNCDFVDGGPDSDQPRAHVGVADG